MGSLSALGYTLSTWIHVDTRDIPCFILSDVILTFFTTSVEPHRRQHNGGAPLLVLLLVLLVLTDADTDAAAALPLRLLSLRPPKWPPLSSLVSSLS